MKERDNILILKANFKKAEASFRTTNKLTVLNSENIRLELLDIVTNRNTELELNLHGINFIDSSIIDTFNILYRMAKRFNSVVFMTHVSPDLMELIKLVRVHSVFDIRVVRAEPEEEVQKVA